MFSLVLVYLGFYNLYDAFSYLLPLAFVSLLHHILVGHAISFCIALNCLCVQMFIYSINVNCSHSFMTIHVWLSYAICLYLSWFYLITFYLLNVHALYSTCLKLNESICYVQVFQDTGVYGLSASQVLDLGVSEFCLCSQTHVLSLEFV